jgi:hypothetical protein
MEVKSKKNEPSAVFYLLFMSTIQSDQKENKTEQALQIIGHVVAESYANKLSMHGCRQFCGLKRCYTGCLKIIVFRVRGLVGDIMLTQ